MKSLKSFFILPALALLLDPSTAKAEGLCPEINNQLVVLESAIQSSRLPRCEAGSKKPCCDPARPLTCKSHLELQTRQNELMGKLVVYEGLIAIGKAMEADHSSIQKLELKELRQAKKDVNSFLAEYAKASLLSSSLDADFWTTEDGSSYQGENLLDLEEHISKQCSSEREEIKTFCQELASIENRPAAVRVKIKQALANFAKADNHARLAAGDRINEYKKYQRALELRIGDELVPYNLRGKQHPQIEKIKELGRLLEHPEAGIDDEKAKQILGTAKSLDGLSVNYGEMVNPSEDFEEFFDENLGKGIAGFNQAARAMLKKDKMLENVDKLKKTASTHQKAAMTAIEAAIKDKTSCSQSGPALVECFKRECSPNAAGECSQKGDPRKAQQLHTINRQLRALESHNELQRHAQKAGECLKRPVGEASACVEELKKNLSMLTQDDVDEIRKQLHQTEAALESMNGASSVSDLKLSKAMGLAAYKNKGCMSQDDKIARSGFNTVCSRQSFHDFSQTALALASDAGKIVEFSRNPFINKDLELPARKYPALKSAFLQKCGEGKGDEKLCALYQKDRFLSGEAARAVRKAHRRLKASKTAAMKLPERVDMSEADTSDAWGSFATGFGSFMVGSGVPFFVGYQNAESRHDRMMNYHNSRLTFMQSSYNWQKNNNKIPYYTSYPNTNYGMPYYNYGSAGQFGGSGSSAHYRRPEDYTQFTFAPSAVMDPYGGSSFSSQSNNEGFNFSK